MNLDDVLKCKFTLHPFAGFEGCNVIVIVDPSQQGQQNFNIHIIIIIIFVTMGYWKSMMVFESTAVSCF